MERPRWADVVDDGLFVTVRLPSGKTTNVVMENDSLIQDLNKWIEDTEKIPRNSFALSHRGEYLTRRVPMATLDPSYELQVTLRFLNGRPRGMAVGRRVRANREFPDSK